MEIASYCVELEKQMRKELDALSNNSTEKVITTATRLTVIIKTINELREFVYKYNFTDASEEIHFFKEIKPIFLSQYFFQKSLYRIYLSSSFIPHDEKRKLYTDTLRDINRFASRHQSFHLYCMSGDTSKDDVYFRRGSNSSPIKDIRFSTGFDEKLALILANTMTKDMVTKLYGPENESHGLSWTGKKLDLVELIFALHATGNVNNAGSGVKPVADAFERLFNIDLGNYHDYFQVIRSRKKTKLVFLDKLKASLLARFDDLDVRH